MSTVVALGATHEMEGFALAGVAVVSAATRADLTRAWDDLDRDVGLVILSSEAANVLRSRMAGRPNVLTVVMP